MTWKSLTCILGQFGAAKKSADRRGSAVSARPGEIGVARAPPFSTNRRARTGLKSARFNAPFHNDNVRINNESSSSGESADFDFPPWHFDKKFVNGSLNGHAHNLSTPGTWGPTGRHEGASLRVEPTPVIDPSNALSPSQRMALIQQIIWGFYNEMETEAATHVGYPVAARVHTDYSCLLPFHHLHLNNVGDPFEPANYHINSRSFEIGVLEFFSDLWELDRERMWGYISSGGTESNIQGILVGRENLPGARLFFSSDSHYSVFKAARLLNMDAVTVPARPNGEIDYAALTRALADSKAQGKPAVLSLNVGTTVRGAIDDVDRALEALREAGYQKGEYYIHADAALFGMILPFAGREARNKLTFAKEIDSVAVSGHKFLGVPMPCGVFMCRKERMDKLKREVDYIASLDDTISGSRSGINPIYLWYQLSQKGMQGYTQDVRHVLSMARKLKILLEDNGVMPVLLNPHSNIVVFPKPADEGIVRRWQLATSGDIAHVVVMPTIQMETLAAFARECGHSLATHGPAAANAASLEDLRSHTNARLPIIDEVLEEFDMLPGGRTDVGLAPTARDIITGEPTGRKQSGLKATSVTVEVQTRGRRRRNSPSDVSGTTAGWSPAPRGAIASLGGESVEWGGSWKPPLRPATSNLSTVSRASGRRRNLRSGASRAESSSSVTLEVARSWDPYRGLPIRREGGAFPSTRIFHG